MKAPTEITETTLTRETVQARHPFTPDERLDLSQNLVAAIDKEKQIEAEFDSIKSEYKGRLSKAEIEKNDLTAKLRDGFEMRQTPAIIFFNHPAKGRKAFFREEKDGSPGDFIREEPMTNADFQMPLLNEPKPATTQTGQEEPQNPHQGDPNDLPEAREVEPGLAKRGRRPYEQPPGMCSVNGVEAHWLTMPDLDEVETEAGLGAAFKEARRRAKWSEESVQFAVDQLATFLTVDAKKAYLRQFVYVAPAETSAIE